LAAIGLTGGIAVGKSSFARLLLRDFPMESFDSDRCVHELLAGDPGIRAAIVAAFGSEVLDPQGWPDRTRLRTIVFSHEERRKTLEGILHPVVRSRWMDRVAEARKTKACVLIDIPLLYETGAQDGLDRVIVVACSRETQLRRLTTERGLAPELAAQMIAAQFDLGAKIQKADHVIWNDSTVSNLDGQSRLLASWLREWSPIAHA
jgi:dephospho-CoA kinase